MRRKVWRAVGRGALGMMFLIWTLLILSSTTCHEVAEAQEETDNITTLYPTKNNTKYNASQAKTNADSRKTGYTLTETLNKDERDSNETGSREDPVIERPGNESKAFRPSEHLGSFFDEDSFGFVPLPTKPSLDTFTPLKKPPSSFIGSQKNGFKSIHKPQQTFDRFPFKFESAILTRAKSKWRPTPGLESQPTAAVPVNVPAGGLYSKPDVFKDKPGFGTGDDDFGLEFNDEKEKLVKKRPNPWKSLLHLVTALIPVGLIFSALTPNVITLHSTGPGPAGPGFAGASEPLPPRVFRRSVEMAPLRTPPHLSSPCRRRLLCELAADTNYQAKSTRRGRACYKLRCEEPDALAHALHWLLEHRPAPNRL